MYIYYNMFLCRLQSKTALSTYFCSNGSSLGHWGLFQFSLTYQCKYMYMFYTWLSLSPQNTTASIFIFLPHLGVSHYSMHSGIL
jgi:hypothetical protein